MEEKLTLDINAELNTTDKLFIAAYIRNKCNGTRAWKEISSDPDVSDNVAASLASERLRKIKVKDVIEKKLQQIADLADIDARWALNKRLEIIERSMQSRPVINRYGEPVFVETPEGEIVPAYSFDANSANQALSAVEKVHLQMTEKQDINHTGSISAPLKEEDREILAAYLKKKNEHKPE